MNMTMHHLFTVELKHGLWAHGTLSSDGNVMKLLDFNANIECIVVAPDLSGYSYNDGSHKACITINSYDVGIDSVHLEVSSNFGGISIGIADAVKQIQMTQASRKDIKKSSFWRLVKAKIFSLPAFGAR